MARIVNPADEPVIVPTTAGDVYAAPGVPVDVPDEYAHGIPAMFDDTGALVHAGRAGLLSQGWVLADDPPKARKGKTTEEQS